MDRWLRATINTWHGLIAAARSEAAFREELDDFTLTRCDRIVPHTILECVCSTDIVV